VRPEHRTLFQVEADPAALLDRLMAPGAPPIDKWFDAKLDTPD
jgi:hypothetical protein